MLDCHGWGDLQPELNRLSKRGEWLAMAARIDDAMLEKIAVVGAPGEIAAAVRRRCGKFANRVSLIAPSAPDPSRWVDVVRTLKS